MNGRYRIPLRPDELAEDNPRVKALLKSLDPGAKVAFRIWEEPLIVRHSRGHLSEDRKAMIASDTRWAALEATRYVEITARGGKAKRAKPVSRSGVRGSAPTIEQITKRLTEADNVLTTARAMIRSNLRSQYRDGYSVAREWLIQQAARRGQKKEIGRAVGSILARHKIHAETATKRHGRHWAFMPTAEDYALLDEAIGRKVERMSKVSDGALERSNGYLGHIVRTFTMSYRFGTKRTEKAETYKRPNPIDTFLQAKGEVAYLKELLRLAMDRVTAKMKTAA